MSRTMRSLYLVALLSACAASGPRPATIPVSPGYEAVAAELTRCIEHERSSKELPAISIALVDGGEVVWATGFGEARPGVPADASTIYRVGSVSKLFTDMALMQLVEEGTIDLDEPVQRLVPTFDPGPGAEGVTFRQLTAHRAGIVREPPVGNYFADDEPSLAATVDSLNGTGFRASPGSLTKYSNAGIAVLGRALELHHRQPYAQLMQERILDPLGMPGAAFEPTPAVRRRLAEARMWSYDGSESPAPTFELGMAPAGSLYASVLDLSTFLRALFAGGRGVLTPGTLEEMLTPGAGRFGIGFAISDLDGMRRCGHGGAVYGFSTELGFLPDAQLGAVVTSSMDVSNAVTRRLADHALRCLVARGEGRELPQLSLTEPLEPELATALAGVYAGPAGERAEVIGRPDGSCWLEWRGLRAALRREGEHLRVDDRHVFGARVEPLGSGLSIGAESYERLELPRPAPCPDHLAEYVGEYGWDHNVLVVREVGGALEALIEWFWFDALTEAGQDRFALPESRGLYPLEELVFERGSDGRVCAAVLGGVRFARRTSGTEDGQQFTIDPVHGEDELRALALAAAPPHEEGEFHQPDLVDLARAIPELRFDVRYATTNNFLETVFYPTAQAFLQRPAAAALEAARQELADEGLGLVIYDAYRPWHVTKMFWDATPPEHKHFVADPSRGSRHNRGCAVDLSLVDLTTGNIVETTGGYDEFSARSYNDYPGGTSLQRWYRERLRSAMQDHGFTVYAWEWWHFDFTGWEHYPILDRPFEELD